MGVSLLVVGHIMILRNWMEDGCLFLAVDDYEVHNHDKYYSSLIVLFSCFIRIVRFFEKSSVQVFYFFVKVLLLFVDLISDCLELESNSNNC